MRREPGFWPFMVRFNSQFLNNDATLVTLVEQIKTEKETKTCPIANSLPQYYFTIITAHFALSETFLETLPITNLEIPFRPLLPITMRSTFRLFANSTILCSGLPTSTAVLILTEFFYFCFNSSNVPIILCRISVCRSLKYVDKVVFSPVL